MEKLLVRSMMAEKEVATLLKEAESLFNDYKSTEKQHGNYLKSFKEMVGIQTNSAKSIKHISYVSKQLKKDIKHIEKSKTLTPEQQSQLKEVAAELETIGDKVGDMHCDIPAESNGFSFLTS